MAAEEFNWLYVLRKGSGILSIFMVAYIARTFLSNEFMASAYLVIIVC